MSITRSRGEIVADRAATAEVSTGHIELINRLTSKKLAPDEVYVRSMYLCSNQVCETDWRRFSVRALDQICGKVVGESVLAGHDKRSLPVARFFKAVVEDRPEVVDRETGDPSKWVRAWFYWLKGTRGAQDLALNMDGGIYREVSISWRYRGARCAICDRPPHRCSHTPGEVYEGVRCYHWIDEVVDVLEGSLVYRGADRETAIMGEHHGEDHRRCSNLDRLLMFEFQPDLLTRFPR